MPIQVFPQFNNIIAGFSTKPDNAYALRTEMLQDAQVSNRYVVRAGLVHRNNVCCITKDMLNDNAYIEIDETDGLVTDIPGVRLTTTHGDCLPIYAYDPVNKVIGIAHAGWKGTALGIASKLVVTMREKYGCDPTDIYAYIGPGIGKCHFEFGKADAEKYFFSTCEWTKNYSYEHSDPDKLYLDLKEINEHFLELAGVKHIDVSPDCTYCMEDRYYSYRRAKDTGRMLAYIEFKR